MGYKVVKAAKYTSSKLSKCRDDPSEACKHNLAKDSISASQHLLRNIMSTQTSREVGPKIKMGQKSLPPQKSKNGMPACHSLILICMVGSQGLEPWTRWLRVTCSTNWAKSPYLMMLQCLRCKTRFAQPRLESTSSRESTLNILLLWDSSVNINFFHGIDHDWKHASRTVRAVSFPHRTTSSMLLQFDSHPLRELPQDIPQYDKQHECA